MAEARATRRHADARGGVTFDERAVSRQAGSAGKSRPGLSFEEQPTLATRRRRGRGAEVSRRRFPGWLERFEMRFGWSSGMVACSSLGRWMAATSAETSCEARVASGLAVADAARPSQLPAQVVLVRAPPNIGIAKLTGSGTGGGRRGSKSRWWNGSSGSGRDLPRAGRLRSDIELVRGGRGGKGSEGGSDGGGEPADAAERRLSVSPLAVAPAR